MNIDDLRGMRRGIHLFALSKEDLPLLAAIDRRNGNNERALLLLHGFTSTPAVFRAMVPSFSFYDAIVGPVLPGHADSVEAFANTKAISWLNTAEEACKLLLSEFKEVDVLGLSLGGLLACHLASHFNLHHLYLLAPALDLHLSAQKAIKLAKILSRLGFKEVRGAAGDLFTDEHWEIAYRKLPLSSVLEIINLINTFSFSAPTCPTDVFLGCHDKVVDSQRVAERFKDVDNAKIHWLKNSAHVIPLDGDTESIIACMKENQRLESESLNKESHSLLTS
ncbi:alpha/beta hydrolase [Legionella jordanis]|uniref:Carboxylesterase n=1 Tax=Legionella jordanis TaxID=456 RepID=A0A0W0VD32_9GAMM|nr:alpha/beta fold hydrolase [Legionella jordanis]KTD18043.1 carboxylesterase [Legionella jordanis]RMX02536.1 alpha/beta fold hydrolase [Legionella jordanis]RMX21430.1 alpha/beta fold hydrolase [Legionella jordanis]VEH13865.1 carboxylesterase [Legionella jordanis]